MRLRRYFRLFRLQSVSRDDNDEGTFGRIAHWGTGMYPESPIPLN